MIVPTAAKARLLLIDDEPIIRETLAVIFSKAGYDIRAVESAEAAIALLESNEWIPYLAIVDVNLPGMNGIELAIMMKEQHPDVHVALFSGRGSTAELLEEAQHRGHFFEVVAKPVHPVILLGIASSLLGDASVPQRLRCHHSLRDSLLTGQMIDSDRGFNLHAFDNVQRKTDATCHRHRPTDNAKGTRRASQLADELSSIGSMHADTQVDGALGI